MEAISSQQRRGSSTARRALIVVGCVLIALNLRPAITAVGPLIGDIRGSTGMSATAAGLLTTLPLLAFAVTSPLASSAARRISVERALMVALVVLIAGLLLRSAGSLEAAFAGTAVLGIGVAIGNVLLPSLVRRDFPDHVGSMTSLYATAIAGMAAVGAVASVPLADTAGLGWRGALASWAILAGCALLVWLPTTHRKMLAPVVNAAASAVRLRRSPLAWQIAIFMGMQSLIFYAAITWLPTLLAEGGVTPARAGWMLGLMQVVSLVSTMVVPVLARKSPSQGRLVVATAAACLLALVGLLTMPAWLDPVLVVPLGLGTGGFLGLALVLFVLRAPDASTAGAISGMAQSVGYLLAATGPIGLGWLHDTTGSWTVPLIALIAITLVALAAGLAAARDLQIA